MSKYPFKVFIDGGDPSETIKAEQMLGSIDGQTTNPSLVAKNPQVQKRLKKGEKFTLREINKFYKKVVDEFTAIVDWSVSIEPYVDNKTSAENLLEQVREMNSWSPKAWIKLPITVRGLEVAKKAVEEGIRVNMTLCFSQEQAAAVYSATKGSRVPVFISPFVGRLDDRGESGMDLIKNIITMYEKGDGHVQVVTASLRSLDHLLLAIRYKSPIITIPFKIFSEWADRKFVLPSDSHIPNSTTFQTIPYKEISLDKPWLSYNIYHTLTEIGVQKFAQDWNELLKRE
jgi:transaldolase